jgi:hypothetical protein
MGGEPGAGLLPAIQHEPPVQPVVLDGNEAGRVSPALEEASLCQQLIQPARFVRPEPAPEHQVRAPGDDGDGVYLQHAHTPDRPENVILLGRSLRR